MTIIELDISSAEDWILTQEMVAGAKFLVRQVDPPSFGRIYFGQLVEGEIERWFSCPANLEKTGFDMPANSPRQIAVRSKRIDNLSNSQWKVQIEVMPIYYSPDLTEQKLKALSLTGTDITGQAEWDFQGNAFVKGLIEVQERITEGNAVPFVDINIDFLNPSEGMFGVLEIHQSPTTVGRLALPGYVEGSIDTNPGRKTRLFFSYQNSQYYWDSSYKTKVYSLARNSQFVFRVDPVNGVDDDNVTTPFKTINETIRKIKEYIPFNGLIPAQTAGYSGDRTFAARIELAPGQYNESCFFQCLNGLGIEVVGMGSTSTETTIYGTNQTNALKVSNSSEIRFSNLHINSRQIPVYCLNAENVSFSNCEFTIRDNQNVGLFYSSRRSRVVLSGTIKINSSSVKHFANCNVLASCEFRCTLLGAVNFTQSFVNIYDASLIQMQNLVIDASAQLTGLAYEVDDTSIARFPANPILGLTYPS